MGPAKETRLRTMKTCRMMGPLLCFPTPADDLCSISRIDSRKGDRSTASNESVRPASGHSCPCRHRSGGRIVRPWRERPGVRGLPPSVVALGTVPVTGFTVTPEDQSPQSRLRAPNPEPSTSR
jgi:hypothetical protein